MARYIEANALVRTITLYANRTSLGQICPPDLSYSEMLEIIADAPTADVAPRAEVAREIFEEIERFLKSQEAISENKRLKEVGDWIFHDYLPTQLAALKKKYTEEQ